MKSEDVGRNHRRPTACDLTKDGDGVMATSQSATWLLGVFFPFHDERVVAFVLLNACVLLGCCNVS